MTSECARIADQLNRAFTGDAWHGPSLHELLKDVNPEQALAHPPPSAHSIWQLVLHIDIYVVCALEAIQGTPMPKLYGMELDWPPILDKSADAWKKTSDDLFRHTEQLGRAV